MSEPTFIPLSVGDTNDDDGQVFDDMFKPNPFPETPDDAPVVHHEEKPEKPSRLIANSVVIPAGATQRDAVQLAWSDLNRKSLHVLITGAPADFVFLADETTKLSMVSATGMTMALRANSALLPITFDGYTGPLWLITDATPMTAPLTVAVVSVTK